MATTQNPLARPVDTDLQLPERSRTDDLRHRMSDATSQVRHKASELGRSAKESIDRNFHNAAGGFEKAASAIRERMPQGEGRMSGMASTTADKLDSTARYLRTHDTSDLYHGVESWARRNPGAALGAAAGIGLLLGMTMKRDRRYRY